MVSKNNNHLYDEKMNRNHFSFSLRKLNVGVASVLLGIGFGFGLAHTNVAQADTPATTDGTDAATTEAATSAATTTSASTAVLSAATPTSGTVTDSSVATDSSAATSTVKASDFASVTPAVDGVNVIESGTTDENAERTVNGTVVSMPQGTPLSVGESSVAQTPLAGVRVYAQWYVASNGTTDHAPQQASPIYTTTTDANGNYHIVMKDFTGVDADGNAKVYQFNGFVTPGVGGYETFRIWTETPEGKHLFYSWENSEVGPQSASKLAPAMDTSYNASNAAVKHQINDINFIYVDNSDNAVMHNTTSTNNDAYVQENKVKAGSNGTVSGRVFWNNTINFGAQTLGATTTYNGNDEPARNVEVTASYLSDYALQQIYSAGKTYMGKNIRGTGWTLNDEAKLQEWIQEQIKAEGTDKWIAETVSTTTDSDGNYTIQFNGTYGNAYNNLDYNDNVKLPTGLHSALYDSTTVLPTDIANEYGLEAGTATYANLAHLVAKSASEGNWYKDTSSRTDNVSLSAAPKHVNWDWSYVSLDDALNSYGDTSFYRPNYFQASTLNSLWTNTFKIDAVANNYITGADFALYPAEYNMELDHTRLTRQPLLVKLSMLESLVCQLATWELTSTKSFGTLQMVLLPKLKMCKFLIKTGN